MSSTPIPYVFRPPRVRSPQSKTTDHAGQAIESSVDDPKTVLVHLVLAGCVRRVGKSPPTRSSGLPVPENLFLRNVLSSAEQQTATADGFREFRAAVLVTVVSLAQRCRGGEGGDSNQLGPARLPAFLAVDVTRVPVLGGLHHEYRVEKAAA